MEELKVNILSALVSLLHSAIWTCLLTLPHPTVEGKSALLAQQTTTLTPADQQVLDSVLRDLLHDPELLNRRPRNSKNVELVLVRETPDWGPIGLHTQGEPSALDGPIPSISRPLLLNLISRNTDPKHKGAIAAQDKRPFRLNWSAYKSLNKQIVMRDMSTFTIRRAHYDDWFWKQYPNAKGLVWAWLPGYSEDGQTAVVEFVFGPAPELWGIYVLTKQQGKWGMREHYLGPPTL